MAISLIMFASAPHWLALADYQTTEKQSVLDISGTWGLPSKSGSHLSHEIILVISQTEPQIKITERTFRGHGTIRELTYYTDSRGETNPSFDVKTMLKSVTKWKGNKLITKFSLPAGRSNNNPVVSERVDEWTISADGQTLTRTSYFKNSSPQQDPSVNPYGSPRMPNILTTPLSWQEKRSFERLP